MSDIMFYGVLRMPQHLAMADPLSRGQFYSRAQEAANRVEAAEKRIAELEARLAAAPVAAQGERQPDECDWHQEDDENMPDTYRTRCGELWSFIEGGPVHNRVKFCHGCGKPVKEIQAWPEPLDE